MQTANSDIWHIILNPHAGSGKGFRDRAKIIEIIDRSGLNYELYTSEYAGHAVEIARELSFKGATRFIAAGGDGTLNELVNGFFGNTEKREEKIVLGMIPVGTGNDWIKTFGIPDDYMQATNIIKNGKTVTQDVGEITYHLDGKEIKRHFVNIAGFGFDGMVATRANRLKAKGISGFRVYAGSLFSSYLSFNAQKTLIIIDGISVEKNLFSVSIGIGKYNGGGMMQVPDANPLQGVFHITLISKIGLMGILKNFRGLYNGKFISDKHVSTYTGKEIFIKPTNALPGEADGEPLGDSDFSIKILPHKLKVICGNTCFKSEN